MPSSYLGACAAQLNRYLAVDDATFDRLFGGDALLGVTGGTIAMLEPIALCRTAPRDVFAWKRGETTATAGQLLAAENLVKRAIALLG